MEKQLGLLLILNLNMRFFTLHFRLLFSSILLLTSYTSFASNAPLISNQTSTVPTLDTARLIVVFENDTILLDARPTDKWYTAGTEIHYIFTPTPQNISKNLFLEKLLPGISFKTNAFEFLLGQAIFTPVNLSLNPPDPKDRPYAGWLYAGLGLFQETNYHSLDHLEVQVGIVGPASMGQAVQLGYHRLIGQIQPPGWDRQLKNEPGIVLSYEHKWRFGAPLIAGLSADVIPELGASLGNIYTYAETSILFRLGQNLNADYGVVRMRPALSGNAYFDPSQLSGSLGWYFFMGSQGRAIARNIFLDGNTWQNSARVQKIPFVADFTAGFSIFWTDQFKADISCVVRTKEFVNQSDLDRYTGINLTFKLP